MNKSWTLASSHFQACGGQARKWDLIHSDNWYKEFWKLEGQSGPSCHGKLPGKDFIVGVIWPETQHMWQMRQQDWGREREMGTRWREAQSAGREGRIRVFLWGIVKVIAPWLTGVCVEKLQGSHTSASLSCSWQGGVDENVSLRMEFLFSPTDEPHLDF